MNDYSSNYWDICVLWTIIYSIIDRFDVLMIDIEYILVSLMTYWHYMMCLNSHLETYFVIICQYYDIFDVIIVSLMCQFWRKTHFWQFGVAKFDTFVVFDEICQFWRNHHFGKVAILEVWSKFGESSFWQSAILINRAPHFFVNTVVREILREVFLSWWWCRKCLCVNHRDIAVLFAPLSARPTSLGILLVLGRGHTK